MKWFEDNKEGTDENIGLDPGKEGSSEGINVQEIRSI